MTNKYENIFFFSYTAIARFLQSELYDTHTGGGFLRGSKVHKPNNSADCKLSV